MGGIARVSEEEVKQQFTAKDLIGAEVYDRAGEKIGDISDVAFAGDFAPGLAGAYTMSRASQSDSMSDARSTGTPGRTPQTTAPSGTAAGSSLPSSSAGTPPPTARSPGSPTSSSAPSSGLASLSMEPRVYISVGGLWGIGDDLVSVSASQLSFDSAKDRFVLAANKAEVVALAENDQQSGYAAGSAARPGAGSTAAGKQQFSDEAAKVQNALQSGAATRSFAHKVTVTSDGEDVELRGTVSSEEQHQQILQAARQATSSRIDDKIEVNE